MTTVSLTSYSDADFSYQQNTPFTIGVNPCHMQMRSAASDPTVWLEATTANGRLIVAGSSPEKITIFLAQPLLFLLPAGVYVYSVIMSSVSGTLRTEVFRGTLTHNIGPTRWAAGTP